MTNQVNEVECCPKFDPKGWDGKTYVWKQRKFIKDSIPQFMHIPWPPMIGKTITRMWEAAKKSHAEMDKKDFLLLMYDPSPWKSEFFMSVTRDVEGAENVELTGTFITKVYEGPYNDVPKWIKDMDGYLAGKNKKALKYYFYYTTCPACAKKWGKNYVVVFAQVA